MTELQRLAFSEQRMIRALVTALRAEAKSVGGPLYVQQLDDELYVVRDRATDLSVGDVHESLKDALNALLRESDVYESAIKVPVLRGQGGAPEGVWRWLDASAEEPEPDARGSQVTAEAIRTMIDRLNASSQPIMIDGGSADSGAHASVQVTDTRANGFAHVACEWREAEGRVHLALYVELVPEVVPDVDSGRLAFGSIAFVQDKSNLADAALWSHALTNLPAVAGLTPNSALRTEIGMRVFVRAQPVRSSLDMNKNIAARGPAADKLNALKVMLGIGADVSEEDAMCQIHDAIWALKQGATLEKILEGGGVAELAKKPDESVESYAARVAALRADPPPAADGAGSPEADKAAMEDIKGVLATVFAQPDASLAALVEMLKASQDLFKGAVASSGANKQDGGQAEANAVDVQAMSQKTDEARMRAITLEAQSKAKDEAVIAERARAEKAEAELERRDLRDMISGRFAEAKLTLSPEQLDEFTGLLARSSKEDREKVLDLQLRAINVPSLGRKTKGATAESVEASAREAQSATVDANAAYEAALKAVATEHPEWSSRQRHSEAYKRTRAALVESTKASN